MPPRRRKNARKSTVRVSALHLPAPLLEYLYALPGDYLKITLRLLQRAKWVRGPTDDGIELDAGEVLISSRSEKLWGSLRFDRRDGRELTEDGRRALVRRALERLEHDGKVARRPAHPRGPPSGPPSGPRGPAHPPTIAKWLVYRDILWPANVDAAHPPDQKPAHLPAHPRGPILASVPDPPVVQPAAAAAEAPAAAAADGMLIAFKKRLETAIGRPLKLGSRTPKELEARCSNAIEEHGIDGVIDLCQLRDGEVGKERIRSLAGFLTMVEEDYDLEDVAEFTEGERDETEEDELEELAASVNRSRESGDRWSALVDRMSREHKLAFWREAKDMIHVQSPPEVWKRFHERWETELAGTEAVRPEIDITDLDENDPGYAQEVMRREKAAEEAARRSSARRHALF